MEDLTLKKYTLHRLKSKLIEKKYEHCIKAETDICSLLENYTFIEAERKIENSFYISPHIV